MVEFNQNISLRSIENQTNRSSPTSSGGLGNLFSNLGKAAEIGLKTQQEATKSTSLDEVRKAIEGVDTSFGFSGDGTPQGLKNQLERAKRMADAAKRAGGTSSSLYWSRMNAAIRDVRSKYPGFGKEIDQKVSSILGTNPRRQAVKSFFDIQRAAAKTVSDFNTNKQAFYQKDEAGIALFAGVSPESIDSQTFAKHKQMATVWKQRKIQIERDELEGKVTKGLVERNANLIFNTVMTSAMENPSLKKLETVLASGVTNVTGDELKGLIQGITQLEAALDLNLQKALFKYAGSNGVTNEDINKVKKETLDRLNTLKSLIGSKDFNLANFFAKMNSFSTDTTWNQILEGNPQLRVASVLTEKVGRDYATYILNKTYGEGNAWIPLQNLSLATKGGPTQGDLFKTLSEDNNKTKGEKNEGVRELAKTLIRGVLATSDANVVENLVNKVYDAGSLKQQLSVIEDGDLAYLHFITRPDVAKKIYDTGSTEVFEKFQKGLVEAFLASSDFKTLNRDLAKFTTLADFSLNKSGQLVYTPSEGSEKVSKSHLGRGVEESTAVSLKPILDKVNPVLRNIFESYKVAGLDPTQEVLGILKLSGLDISSSEGEGGEPKKGNLEGVIFDKAVLDRAQEALAKSIDIGETGGAADYDTLFGFSNNSVFSGVTVSKMTVDEVLNFTRAGGDYMKYTKSKIGVNATPVGRYQIVGSTLRSLKKKLGLKGDEVFSEDLQDKMFSVLLNQAGYQDFVNDKITVAEFLNRADDIWKGLKDSRKSRNAFLQSLIDQKE